MFTNWSITEKTSLFVVSTINLPLEIAVPEYESKTWSYDLLKLLASELGVEESYIDAYLPMVLKTEYFVQEWNEKMDLVQPFLVNLAHFDKVKIYVQLLMFLIVNRYYDSRGRVLIRNLRYCFGLTAEQYIAMEVHLSKSLLDYQNALSHKADEKDKKSKYMRYAKIGVAAVGAGAVLALTGGLAAPAIAGAMLVMGSSAGAAAASVTVMATVFGSAGAGLTGYKMMKRTKGIQEFEFEQYDSQGQVAVMIMISGWLESEEDYKRSFGILPKEMTFRERLFRYYQLYCPERIATIDEEVEIYEEYPERLFGKLEKMFGKDPLNNDNLLPPAYNPDTSSASAEEATLRMLQFIESCIEGTAVIDREDGLQATVSITDPSNTVTSSKENVAEVRDARSDPESKVVVESLNATALREMTLDSLAELGGGTGNAGSTGTSTAEGSEGGEQVPADLVHLFDSHYWNWRELKIAPLYELYLLRWEVKLQQDLGHSIIDLLKSLSSAAVQNVLAYTVFTALASAVMWPVLLLKMTDMIDSLWTIAIERTDQAGKELAKVLLARPQGSRPVTLVGFSLGSRVIFSCLKELSKLTEEDRDKNKKEGGKAVGAAAAPMESPSKSHKGRKGAGSAKVGDSSTAEDGRISDDFSDASTDEGSLFEGEGGGTADKSSGGTSTGGITRHFFFSKKPKEASSSSSTRAADDNKNIDSAGATLSAKDVKGLISDVVLLGAPISLTSRHWGPIRNLVAGRLINGFSSKDKVLSIIYRYQRFKFSISGVSPVTCVPGIENVDLSSIVDKHVDYGRKMKDILELIDLTNKGGTTSSGGGHIVI